MNKLRLFDRVWAALRRPRIASSPTTVYVKVAGMTVTNDSALQLAAVWACVRIISETIATLGWHIVHDMPDGTKRREVGTQRDRLLNQMANPEMTAFVWRETALAHCLLWGNHYSEIVRDAGGRPQALYPIDPSRVLVERDENERVVYRVLQDNAGYATLQARDVLHVHGLGTDGINGISVVAFAQRSIGVGLALDEFGSSFYKHGAHVGAALKHPGKLSASAKDYLKASFADAYAGASNAHKTLVLEEGMSVEKLSMSMVDAQFLESRKFQVSEICRWFRVPPHKVADLDRATFSNIEHQSIEFVQDTILPWCRRLEQEVDAKLFGQWAATTRLNIDTLLRGDIASRYAAYQKGREGGWLSANDVRRLESMDPIENGDIYLQPMNYQEAGADPIDPKPESPPDASDNHDPAEGDPPTSNLLTWRPRKEAAQ